MDCNIKCCTLVISVALIATYVYSEKTCSYGMKTLGYTEPVGDILLEYGQPLEINCTLTDTKYNASALTFSGLGYEVSKEHLTIVSDDTLRLYIPKPKIQAGTYTCKLKTEYQQRKESSGVCLNKVIVGLRPQKVKNFTCVSYNWNNINCSWIPPNNNIITSYSLSYSLGKSKPVYSCPNKTETSSNSCYWDDSTSPAYRQPHNIYNFNLTASNKFGTNSELFSISNYESVIPNKVRNLTFTSTTVNSISLRWSVPEGLEHFPLGLIHQVEYKNEYEDWQIVNTSSLCIAKCNSEYQLVLKNLTYANTEYKVRVKTRVGKNDVAYYRWSDYANIFPKTMPTIPRGAPQTTVGSFEIVNINDMGLRDVNLYWKEVPKEWECGDEFQYKIIVVEEDGVFVNITPSEISSFYASFKNLTLKKYRFEIVSWNIIGRSVESSNIMIPAEKDMPLSPEQVTQRPFNMGTYEISWEKPSHKSKISSYTIFWCKNKSDRPYQCSGNINWTSVDSNVHVMNLTDLAEVYQLGVSSNRGAHSSGIAWASCTVQPDRKGRLKSPSLVHSGSNYIYISWKLECSNKIGLAQGFTINYFECISHNCSSETCDSQTNCKTVPVEQEIRSYNITDLKPLTNYSITISIRSNSESLKSDPLIGKTEEGVPDQIKNVTITNKTSTTISLNWSPPENTNGVLLYYTIEGGRGLNTIVKTTSYELEDLESFKQYIITVKGCTNAGCGPPSIPLNVTTLIGHPKVPDNIQLKSLNTTMALFGWNPPPATAGNLTYYTIKFEIKSDGKSKYNETKNVTMNQIELPWEKCVNDGATKYNFQVRAVNSLEDGSILEGDWSQLQEGPCMIPVSPPHLTVIIPLFAVLLSLVLCIFCAVFSQHLWVKFNQMRDIGVKLPARLGTRLDDKTENHTIHIWNNHTATDNSIYSRPSPDEQSLLKVKEEIEMIQDESSVDRDSLQGEIQNSTLSGETIPVDEIGNVHPSNPSPGYILVAPQAPPSGYVTIPPLARGYMMALPPSPNPPPNPVSPSLPQCSMSLKQNGLNSISPNKPFNSFPEPNRYGDMISPINST